METEDPKHPLEETHSERYKREKIDRYETPLDHPTEEFIRTRRERMDELDQMTLKAWQGIVNGLIIVFLLVQFCAFIAGMVQASESDKHLPLRRYDFLFPGRIMGIMLHDYLDQEIGK